MNIIVKIAPFYLNKENAENIPQNVVVVEETGMAGSIKGRR